MLSKMFSRFFKYHTVHNIYWQDVLTDLKADAETLPLDPCKEEWVGHKVFYMPNDCISKYVKVISLYTLNSTEHF